MEKTSEQSGLCSDVVRAAGFEPTVSWTRTKRDTKLRHARMDRLLS